MCICVCVCVCECHGVYVHTSHSASVDFSIVFFIRDLPSHFLLAPPSSLQFSCFSLLFPTLQNLFPCLFGFLPCVYFVASFSSTETESHKHCFPIQKANPSLSVFLILPEAWLADVNRHKPTVPATAYLTFLTVQRRKSGWGGGR